MVSLSIFYKNWLGKSETIWWNNGRSKFELLAYRYEDNQKLGWFFLAAYVRIKIWVVMLNFNHKEGSRYDIYFVSFIKLSKFILKSNYVHWKSKSKTKSVIKFSSPVQIPIVLLQVVLSCFHRNTDVITICLFAFEKFESWFKTFLPC